MLRLLTAALLACLLAATAPAGDHDHDSGHAASEKLGSVNFETGCAPDVQEDFNRAVALLHSFEFGPAIDGFDGVLAEDPSCAIAHWGIALSYWGNPFSLVRSDSALEKGSATIEGARAVEGGSARERAYIEAVATLFEDYEDVSQRERVLAYARAMERVSVEHPEDTEAAIFYALAVNQTALPTDKTYAMQLKAAGILEPLVEKYPDHPGLTHYIIHAYDHPPLASPRAHGGAALREIAPSAPHALHMPSHTFTRVGAWDESAATNRRSEQTAIEQGLGDRSAARNGLPGLRLSADGAGQECERRTRATPGSRGEVQPGIDRRRCASRSRFLRHDRDSREVCARTRRVGGGSANSRTGQGRPIYHCYRAFHPCNRSCKKRQSRRSRRGSRTARRSSRPARSATRTRTGPNRWTFSIAWRRRGSRLPRDKDKKAWRCSAPLRRQRTPPINPR